MVDNELITKVRTRNVKSILSNVFTSSGGTITNGNGTTANGTAVDLGGTISGDVNNVWGSGDKSYYFGYGQSSDVYTPYIEIIKAPNSGQISAINLNARGSLGSYKGFLSLGGYNNAALAEIGSQIAGVTKKIGFDAVGCYLTLGSDATGDTYHRNASGYLTRRGVLTATSTATLTPNSDTTYQSCLTAQAEALTIANPTGTPFNGQDLIVRVKDNGTARAITFGSQFRAIGTALPTTTTAGKVLYICSLWNAADSKWDTVNHLEV